MPITPPRAKATYKSPPDAPVLGCPLKLAPGQPQSFDVRFKVLSPQVSWSSPFPLALGVPGQAQHEHGDLQKIEGGLNLLKAGHPTYRHQLKVLKGG